ncbi:RNA helicase, putative [Babesia caballi]|uniref:RNA helicase, putative n=1 Tax=Babesia caballi TaxID=5871 RepID=A0AAV4LNF2_BABCB|nr:RNA helicase, putative [Babesia caballi]
MGSQCSAANPEGGDFATLGIDSRIREALLKRGVARPSRQQCAAIRAMLSKENIVLQSKSGTGKTLGFCIAVVQLILGPIGSTGTPLQTTEGEPGTTTKDDDTEGGFSDDGKTSEKREDGIVESEVSVVQGGNLEGVESEASPEVGEDKVGSPVCDGGEDETVENGCRGKEWNERAEAVFGNVVIVAPTRELATQIHRTVCELSEELPDIRVSLNVGGTDLLADVNDLVQRTPQIVVATPGRLLTLWKQIKRLLGSSKLQGGPLYWNTVTLVLDEADMLLDEHFVDQTKNLCMKLVNPFMQVIATSATFVKVQFKLYEDILYEVDAEFIRRVLPLLGKGPEETFESVKRSYGVHVTDSMKRLVEEGYQKPFDLTMESEEEGVTMPSEKKGDEGGVKDGVENGSKSENPDFGETQQLKEGSDVAAITAAAETLKSVFDFLTTFSRKIQKIIVSASHVNRVQMPTKNVVCFTENDCLQTVQAVKEAIRDGQGELIEQFNSPVLQNVVFYYAQVPEAPNIVKQISLKLRVVVKMLEHLQYRKCIVFCNQSHTRMLMANALERLGLSCCLCSSRQSHESRRKTVESANKKERNVIIAADVISRGIHIDNVDLIINVDIPATKEAFLHRSGRTGRFGRYGMCVTVCTAPEMKPLEYLEYALNFKCAPIEDIVDVDSGDDANAEKRECEPEVAESTKGAEVPLGEHADAENGAAVSPGDASKTEPDSGKFENVAKASEDGESEEEGLVDGRQFDDTVREPLVASIHSSVFPGMLEYIIPAFSVLASHDVYLEGVEPASICGAGYGSVDAPTSENTFRLRFREFHSARVVLHVSSQLYQCIAECDRGEEAEESLHHIVAVQREASAISILDPVHRIFRPVKGALLISVRVDDDAQRGLCGARDEKEGDTRRALLVHRAARGELPGRGAPHQVPGDDRGPVRGAVRGGVPRGAAAAHGRRREALHHRGRGVRAGGLRAGVPGGDAGALRRGHRRHRPGGRGEQAGRERDRAPRVRGARPHYVT